MTYYRKDSDMNTPFTPAQLDDALDAYVECALWSSTDTDPATGDPVHLDDYPATFRLRADLSGDLFDFLAQTEVVELIAATGQSVEQAAHDFWLTRNGHGAGFWDRGYGQAGDRLTKIAKVYGDVSLYLTIDEYVAV